VREKSVRHVKSVRCRTVLIQSIDCLFYVGMRWRRKNPINRVDGVQNAVRGVRS
jgi:hypothetical protein